MARRLESGRAWRSARRRVAAVLIGVIAPAALSAQRPLVPPSPRDGRGTTATLRITADGRVRHVLLHLPPGPRGAPLPTLLVLHGDGASGAVVRRMSQMDAEADRLGFVVAYPDGTPEWGGLRHSWNAATCCGRAREERVDDVRFLDSLVARLVADGVTDPTRVGVSGFSAGGMLALRAACRAAGRYVLAADVAGVMPDTTCRPGAPMSVLLFQGRDDEELRYDLQVLRRPKGSHRFAHSLEEALRFWARHDGCDAGIARDSVASRLRLTARGCPSGVTVALFDIADHPHAWPGGRRSWWLGPAPSPRLSASEAIAEALMSAPACLTAAPPR